MLLRHAFLELKVVDKGVTGITNLGSYEHLMYVNLSKNQISDVSVLEKLPTLVQLNLSYNELESVLGYFVPHCRPGQQWANGDTAIGSMLTLANLSFNKITQMRDISAHRFLEVLLLSNNSIEKIEGVSQLQYLKILDLSNNNIRSIENLDNMNITELNLSNNKLIDLKGLEQCSRLSVLNAANNDIQSLVSLSTAKALRVLNVRDNRLKYIRQVDYIQSLLWLGTVEMLGNPCCHKPFYRTRVIYRLPSLTMLDINDVTPEEQIESQNLYLTNEGDIETREQIYAKIHPHTPLPPVGHFTNNFNDDEETVTPEELAMLWDFHNEVSEVEVKEQVNISSFNVVDMAVKRASDSVSLQSKESGSLTSVLKDGNEESKMDEAVAVNSLEAGGSVELASTEKGDDLFGTQSIPADETVVE
jgi:hypothetical protein